MCMTAHTLGLTKESSSKRSSLVRRLKRRTDVFVLVETAFIYNCQNPKRTLFQIYLLENCSILAFEIWNDRVNLLKFLESLK